LSPSTRAAAPKFYKSPKLKDVDLPDDATNIPHPAHTKFDHYYSNEEVLDIWAKPLDSKDYLPTKLELEQLRKDPSPDKFRAYVLFGAHAPCNAYILNMKIDKCHDPKLGQTNKTMLQRSQCNRHFYHFTTCLNRHKKWYDARFQAFADELPDIAPKYQKDVDYTQDPSLYEEFAPKKSSKVEEEEE
jgi:hypothetical protein